MESEFITYEQPLSEHIRVCLRLEQIFARINEVGDDLNPWNTQILMSAIVDVLIILDRSDLKTKLTNGLNRYIEKLSPLASSPDIDQSYLQDLLSQLNFLLNYLINTNGKIAQNLRESELLNDLKQHHTNLGGPTCMDTPAYYYWLQQPKEEKAKDITHWLDMLKPIEEMTTLILQLTRGSRDPQNKVAESGFYHQVLNPKNNARLIRITLPRTVEAYPEISVGPHRVNIRWYTPKGEEKSTPIEYDIPFELTCCD